MLGLLLLTLRALPLTTSYLWMKQDFIKGNITPAVGRLWQALLCQNQCQ